LREIEEQYVRSFTQAPEVIVLDIDSTDDPTHGQQQLSCFHGYYDQHIYHPFLIFDGESGQLVSAVLRPGNAHAARGAMGVLRRIIGCLKQRFPHVQIVVRGSCGWWKKQRENGAGSPTSLAWRRMPSSYVKGRRPWRKPARAVGAVGPPSNNLTPLPMAPRVVRRRVTWS